MEQALWHWEDYVPTFGTNASESRPFKIRIKSGISNKARDEATKRIIETAKDRKTLTEILSEYAVAGDEPVFIDGKKVSSLGEYLEAIEDQANGYLVTELIGAFLWHNSHDGAQATFSGRLSGGSVFTRSSAPEMATARNGSATRA